MLNKDVCSVSRCYNLIEECIQKKVFMYSISFLVLMVQALLSLELNAVV